MNSHIEELRKTEQMLAERLETIRTMILQEEMAAALRALNCVGLVWHGGEWVYTGTKYSSPEEL